MVRSGLWSPLLEYLFLQEPVFCTINALFLDDNFVNLLSTNSLLIGLKQQRANKSTHTLHYSTSKSNTTESFCLVPSLQSLGFIFDEDLINTVLKSHYCHIRQLLGIPVLDFLYVANCIHDSSANFAVNFASAKFCSWSLVALALLMLKPQILSYLAYFHILHWLRTNECTKFYKLLLHRKFSHNIILQCVIFLFFLVHDCTLYKYNA